MEIKGKVYCFFEQSGVFKNEFRKLGYDAYDYDIQNNYGQTDIQIDLFDEIEDGYVKKPSVFDYIKEDDLILCFFPCIYFATLTTATDFSLCRSGTESKSLSERIEYALDRLKQRTLFHSLLYKMVAIADKRGLRLIIENPATEPNYLISGHNFLPPTIIDRDRTLRGDYFKKPTAFWFINCENTNGFSLQKDKEVKKVQECHGSKGDGLCSEERSAISSDYARNFICDFILGVKNEYNVSLF